MGQTFFHPRSNLTNRYNRVLGEKGECWQERKERVLERERERIDGRKEGPWEDSRSCLLLPTSRVPFAVEIYLHFIKFHFFLISTVPPSSLALFSHLTRSFGFRKLNFLSSPPPFLSLIGFSRMSNAISYEKETLGKRRILNDF